MWFLLLLSWISTLICLSFAVLSVASGLYYVAELVEEYTSIAGRVIKYMIWTCLFVYLMLLLFEDLSYPLIVCGFVTHVIHLMIWKNFPYFDYSSFPFISGVAMLFINHYLAFNHFAGRYLPFSQVLGYFTICVWMVPLAFFVSLSANDNVLPVTTEAQPLLDSDGDLVSNYFMRKSGRRIGLLSFFTYAKESILPQRIKKSF